MSLKNAKMNYVVDVSTNLFMQKSISDVTIKEIAEAAEIGEATIYRYFYKKENIVIACIMNLQEKVSNNYFKLSEGKTGYEKIAIFYNSFLDVFKDNPDYFYFLKEFDGYMSVQNKSSLKDYEKEVDRYKTDFMIAYDAGINDGSIEPVKNVELFYFSTTHALIELCKKLSLKRVFLSQDKTMKKSQEIQTLIKIILKSLKK